ncbi:hypothetical protein Avbf_10457 [Armadillidium vulgare]|nr:hypothetical protein Avbf_10457 [Armadillidium vulgare]
MGWRFWLSHQRETNPFCLPDKPLSPPLQSSVPCDSVITKEEFNITSPSFPGLYPDDVECHYQVLQSNWNICGLLLTPLI